MGTNRTALRRAIGDKTGDMMVLEGTDIAPSTATFTDVVRLGDRGDNAPSLVNRIGYFSGGTAGNLGHECRTTAFQSNIRTLSFTPAAAASPLVGDELELWSIADRVGSVGTIHRLINDAIRSVQDIVGEEVYGTAAAFDAYNPTIAIPIAMYEVGGLIWTDTRGYDHDVVQDNVLVRGGTRRTIEIRKRGRRLTHGRSVILWGYERAAPLDADAAETNVDAEWLVESVAAVMSLATAWRTGVDNAASERRANFWASRADMYRRKVGNQRRGWGLTV